MTPYSTRMPIIAHFYRNRLAIGTSKLVGFHKVWKYRACGVELSSCTGVTRTSRSARAGARLDRLASVVNLRQGHRRRTEVRRLLPKKPAGA